MIIIDTTIIRRALFGLYGMPPAVPKWLLGRKTEVREQTNLPSEKDFFEDIIDKMTHDFEQGWHNFASDKKPLEHLQISFPPKAKQLKLKEQYNALLQAHTNTIALGLGALVGFCACMISMTCHLALSGALFAGALNLVLLATMPSTFFLLLFAVRRLSNLAKAEAFLKECLSTIEQDIKKGVRSHPIF